MKKLLLLAFIFSQNYLVFGQYDSSPINFNQSQLKKQAVLDTIPFRFINNNIIVEINVQGEKGNFVLDTGAPSIISKAFQKKLNLPAIGSIKVRGANNQVQQQDYLVLRELQIQKIGFIQLPVLVIDLEQTPMKDSPIPIDGMIGSNQLKDLVVQIDVNNNILILTDDVKRLGLNKKESIKMKLDKNSRPFIPINISGKKSQALLDTGFNGLYAMPISFYHFHQKHFSQYSLKKGGVSSSYTTIYGETKSENLPLIRCPYLKIGKTILEKVVTLPYPSQEALLGMELLEEGMVTLDYLNKRFYFPLLSIR